MTRFATEGTTRLACVEAVQVLADKGRHPPVVLAIRCRHTFLSPSRRDSSLLCEHQRPTVVPFELIGYQVFRP